MPDKVSQDIFGFDLFTHSVFYSGCSNQVRTRKKIFWLGKHYMRKVFFHCNSFAQHNSAQKETRIDLEFPECSFSADIGPLSMRSGRKFDMLDETQKTCLDIVLAGHNIAILGWVCIKCRLRCTKQLVTRIKDKETSNAQFLQKWLCFIGLGILAESLKLRFCFQSFIQNGIDSNRKTEMMAYISPWLK